MRPAQGDTNLSLLICTTVASAASIMGKIPGYLLPVFLPPALQS
jgi:hypothetical protein